MTIPQTQEGCISAGTSGSWPGLALPGCPRKLFEDLGGRMACSGNGGRGPVGTFLVAGREGPQSQFCLQHTVQVLGGQFLASALPQALWGSRGCA